MKWVNTNSERALSQYSSFLMNKIKLHLGKFLKYDWKTYLMDIMSKHEELSFMIKMVLTLSHRQHRSKKRRYKYIFTQQQHKNEKFIYTSNY